MVGTKERSFAPLVQVSLEELVPVLATCAVSRAMRSPTQSARI
jgi:hypothetical protein